MFALAKLPSLPSRTIYRGVKIDMSQEFLKDKTYIWWSFSSCTSMIEVIKHFLGEKGPRTIINVESDSAKDISRHSFYQTENEILLYPARQFQVISSIDLGNQLHIIQLKEIQPPFSLIHIPQITSTIIPTTHQNHRLKDLIDKCQPHSIIDLCCEQLTDEDMHIVVREAVTNKQCKNLNLAINKITSVGVSIIAEALNENTTLESLALSFNDVVDMGVHFLAKILSLNSSSLETLYLDSTGITDDGAAHLAEMLKTNSKFLRLVLNHNNIGDRGVKLLANTLVQHNSIFRYIDLRDNKLVSDSSVDSLVEMLQKNRSLRFLYIADCNLSEKGKERLRQATQTIKDFQLTV
jgi:hypothetical protein